MTLANGHSVIVTGKDEPNLLLSLMSVLVKQLPDAQFGKQLAMAPVIDPASVNEQSLEATMQPSTTTQDTSERSQAKRLQIGVTTKVSQHELVKKVAKKRGVSVSIAARDLLQDGLDRFDHELLTVSPSELLANYERKANDYEGAETENWIIRADRRLVMKTRLRAGEYERSLSSFANFILANALSICPVADAVLAESSQAMLSDDAVAEALKVIEQSVGVKARTLAPQIGLGEQRGLTNMILGGTVQAPARVLAKLSSVLKLPLDVLSVALERRFAAQPVPSFKATEGKPTVQAERKAWSVAVRELQLPTEEQERLLELEG
ncbi:hypothetical protein CAG72_17625 [Photobacterium halotolerans]|uniref:Uncharacterized protein n=2 Tax=Photobacterium halotolerans TaxID=265726 RepID=A0A7X4WDZ9_9GAMM|nr:hypothetical protein [Photobacterium halotolerans]